jgi:hypothetical protein
MADFPSPSSAYGRWNLMDVRDAVMGGNWPATLVADPYYPYVTMLLPGNGTNGAQNNTFLDSSASPLTITRNGNTTQGTFSPYGSNWSNYFNGTGNYLTTATSASGFSFGTGDFTVEFWINSNQTTRCDPVGQDTSYSASGWWGFVFNRSSNNTMEWFENTNPRIAATSVTWNNGQWNHVAVTRSGSSVKMFLNGTQVGSTYTTSFTYGASSVGVIAGVLSDDKTSGPLTGYLSNVRIVKGTAVYTSSFTPSTTPLTAVSGTNLLTCQANRFFDASTNALAITITGTPSVQRFSPFSPTAAYSTSVIGGSGYFDGSGDNLVTSGTGSFNPRSTFTVEFWTYPITNTTVTWINSNTNDNFYIETFSGTLYVGDGSINTISTTPPALNRWTQILLSFDGTTYRLFYNGVSQATSTSLLASNTISAFRIGQKNDASRPFSGYISDMRVLVGTALYTSAFTPPTAPLTAITNTTMLLSYTNAGIIDNAMMNDLETVGNAQISTSVVKYGTGSIAFDGTGDNLYTINSGIPATGAFTLEMWIYPTSASGYQLIYSQFLSGNSGNFQLLWNDTASKFTVNDGSGVFLTSSSTYSTNAWYYLTIVRSGSTFTMYVNGVSAASGTNSYSILQSASYIGTRSVSDGYFNGYIDDFRITKGIARYTTTFTPPTQALSTF